VEHKRGALTQVGLVKLTIVDGQMVVKTLFSIGDKVTVLTQLEMDQYRAALRAQVAQGTLLVHHGGIENKLCSEFDIEAADVCDQLGVLRLMMGHNGHLSALPDGETVPFGMEWLAWTILDKKQDHNATGDAIRQGMVLTFMLQAYLHFWENYVPEDEDEDEDEDEEPTAQGAAGSSQVPAAPKDEFPPWQAGERQAGKRPAYLADFGDDDNDFQ